MTNKVFHVSANYPPRLGGLEKVVEALASQQHAHGLDASVITSALGYTPGYADSVPVKRLKATEVAHTPLIPGLLPALLKVPKKAVVHTHIAQAYVPELVMLASLIKRFEYIAHVHLDIAPSGKAGLLLKLYKPLVLRRVLRKAAFVVVFSDDQKTTMIQKYGLHENQLRVIANGVATRFYHPAPRQLHDKPRLLFVGRLSPQKNVRQLLAALEGVSDTFETTIVGDGELRDELETQAQNLGLQNVRFVGRKDGEALLELYKQADIFVLPSEREGMPLVLLEAMAMALPIVGTDVTGIREMVDEKTGELAPFDDAASLQKALLKLAADPALYQQKSQAAYQKAVNYSWDRVAQQFEKLYDEATR